MQTSELELHMGILLLLHPQGRQLQHLLIYSFVITLKKPTNYLLLWSLDNTEHSLKIILIFKNRNQKKSLCFQECNHSKAFLCNFFHIKVFKASHCTIITTYISIFHKQVVLGLLQSRALAWVNTATKLYYCIWTGTHMSRYKKDTTSKGICVFLKKPGKI